MPISALPVAPSSADPTTFNTRADAFVAALPTLRSEINAALLAFGPGAPFCTAGGSANAITLTTGLNLTSLAAGQSFSWVATADNTGATTINPDGLGALPAVTPLGLALPPGWINQGEIMNATMPNGTQVVVYPSEAYLQSQTASASLFDDAVASTAAVDRIFGTAWRGIEIHIHNLVPATNGANIRLRLGNGSGTMESATDDYEYTANGGASVNSTSLQLTAAVSSSVGLGYSGVITILGASSASTRTRVQADGGYEPSAGGGYSEYRMKGARRALAQHQSFSIFSSSGNVTIDRLTVRGIK